MMVGWRRNRKGLESQDACSRRNPADEIAENQPRGAAGPRRPNRTVESRPVMAAGMMMRECVGRRSI
jgi:hypothetical protein